VKPTSINKTTYCKTHNNYIFIFGEKNWGNNLKKKEVPLYRLNGSNGSARATLHCRGVSRGAPPTSSNPCNTRRESREFFNYATALDIMLLLYVQIYDAFY